MEICTVGSVRGESRGFLAMVDLNGHEARNTYSAPPSLLLGEMSRNPLRTTYLKVR